MSLLDRGTSTSFIAFYVCLQLYSATGHIRAIESQNRELIERVKSAEHEVHRLRTVNEALMLNRAGANITFN